ncbi:MAG: rod shape-determining protein MreC [Armatimonadetes bacterium JP3_11]|jgi:rod shape-determining protein MreC|nr:MAG: rod shape-determining protein MreC [Armatimonadetes bacterium CP1_7O]OYT75999.1 MAG: rod shape-determining protein MreC [Armatimonadetes bacterium JP3_11]RMH08499.1 MAG: rod shape-determining protein MreC [Armatimonadota bacterium]
MKRRRWTWLILAALGLILGVYHNQRVHHGEVNPLTALIRGWILPVQRGAHAATEGAQQFFATLTQAHKALRDHENLVTENALLKQELERLKALESENESLRNLLNLRARLPNEWIGCRIIATYPQPGQQTIVIDRGVRDGVLAGAPVVAGEGLIGVVERADANASIVRGLTAPRMAVSAKVLNAQKVSIGVCEGRGENRLLLNFIPPDAPLQVGDQVVTAGLGGKYPPNLTIGVVEQVWYDRQYSVKKAWVRPAVEIERFSVALVKRGK